MMRLLRLMGRAGICLGTALLMIGFNIFPTVGQDNPVSSSLLPADQPVNLPLSFVPNIGQFEPEVQFKAHGTNGDLSFTSESVTLALPKRQSKSVTTPLKLEFMGINTQTQIVNEDRLPGVVNYLIGSNPSQWHTNVPTYGAIRYTNLYPGIDLHYEGVGNALKGTYIVQPDVDASVINWRYSEANAPQIDANTGDLHLSLSNGTLVTEKAPTVWQTVNGRHIPISAHYTLRDNGNLGFVLGSYDSAYALIIDPVLLYSTYVGGSDSDDVWGIAADGNGYAYVVGRTWSSDFPATSGVLDETFDGSQRDAFVVKIDTNASGAASLVWSTYLGGSGGDDGWGVAVDPNGNVYVAGSTGSNDFPVTGNALEPQKGHGMCCSPDAFLSKLNPEGSTLLYSTYLGGYFNEDGYGVAVDSAMHTYVFGNTNSSDFPISTNAYQPTNVQGHSI